MLKAYTLLVYLHPPKNTTKASRIYWKFRVRFGACSL